jgi:hypothetical protein
MIFPWQALRPPPSDPSDVDDVAWQYTRVSPQFGCEDSLLLPRIGIECHDLPNAEICRQ